jgi:hypothetical protein
VIHVFWLTNRDNQNKQFVSLKDWNSSSNSEARACCYTRKLSRWQTVFFVANLCFKKSEPSEFDYLSWPNNVSSVRNDEGSYQTTTYSLVSTKSRAIAWQVWLGLQAPTPILGGRCLTRNRQKMEGDGNALLTLFQRRVLLEMFDKKQCVQLP